MDTQMDTQLATKSLTPQVHQPVPETSECVQHHEEPSHTHNEGIVYNMDTQMATEPLTSQIQQLESENSECVHLYKEPIHTQNEVLLNNTNMATNAPTPQIEQLESKNSECVQHSEEHINTHNEGPLNNIDTQMANMLLTRQTQQPESDGQCAQHYKEQINTHDEVSLNYKPMPLKWPVLGSLLIVICILLALLESLRHTLPLETTGLSPQTPSSPLSATSLKSQVQRAVMATPAANNRQEIDLPKRLPVPLLKLNSRKYSLENETILPSDNGTGVAMNSTERQPPSGCQHPSITNGTSLNRRCSADSHFLPPASYPDPVYGPIIYVKSECGWNMASPGNVPLWEDPDQCSFSFFYSDSSSKCSIQLLGAENFHMYEPLNSLMNQNNAWNIIFLRAGDSPSDPVDCWDEAGRQECMDQPPCKGWYSGAYPYGRTVSTQTFQLVDDTTITSTIEGYTTAVTSITTGADGLPTTFVQTASISGSVATFTRSGTILITATSSEGALVWTAVSDTTIGPGVSMSTLDALPPGITNHPTTMTLRNQLGVATATVTEYLETLVGSEGSPTATLVVSLETLTDSEGYPAKTVVEFSATGSAVPTIFPNVTWGNEDYFQVTRTRYFAGSFVPVLLSVLLSIVIQLVDKNLKFILPFYALTRPKGASAPDSLCMIPGGLIHLPRSFGLLFRFGEPLSFLSDLLVISSAFLVSLSSEAIGLKIYGKLDLNHAHKGGYYLDLVIANVPSRIITALLVLMVVIIALIWIFLFRVKSGIASNPWSIANCASLVSGELEYTLRPMRTRTKDRYMDNSQIINQLKGKSFGLRHYTRRDGQLGYGIIVMEDSDSGGSDKSLRKVERPGSTQSRLPCKQSRITQCFERQSLWDHGVRGILLAMLCGLLILILYYDMRQMTLEDPFENFMDGQKFGVRFFFVALGVIITLFWDSYFSRTTMMQPYLYLSRSHSQTKTVVSSLPATSVFIALWKAVVQRDPFALAIAFAGVLSKFTPILLSNIPFRSTQTWETHVVCAWFTVSILAFMILVLLWSFFIKWPHMPVDPSTIAGNMYYLCDSPILGDFKGRSVMEKKERDAQMERIQTRYGFGKIAGLSGELGIRVSSSKVEEP